MYERTRLGRSGRAPDGIPTVGVVAGHAPGGRAVHEELAVEPVAPARYRVLATPGLADGFAADDVVELDVEGNATVVERGGNLGVQIHSRAHDDEAVGRLVDATEALGGWLDGVDPGRVIALTFPVGAGFPAVEALLGGYVAEQDAEWYFTNVYGADGETPLGWWE